MKTNMVSMRDVVGVGTALLIACVALVPGFALAAVPQVSVSVSPVAIQRVSVLGGGSHALPITFTRRDMPEESTSGTDTATGAGQNGTNGAPGADGGMVTTGDESETITVVNNGPTNTGIGGNNNGGASSGNGGAGGPGADGGSVRSGGVLSSAQVYNSANRAVVTIIFGNR